MKIEVRCNYCGCVFLREKKHVNENKKLNHKNFCSNECLKAAKESSIDLFCVKCGKPIRKTASMINRSKSGNLYCSRSCACSVNNSLYKSGVTHPNYGTGSGSYRVRALKNYGSFCNLCGYSDYSEMLDVHHIDGNRDNNDLDNLEVLCVWCHALKTREVPIHRISY